MRAVVSERGQITIPLALRESLGIRAGAVLDFTLEQGRLGHVRLVLGGVAPVPRHCPETEALLEGQAPTAALALQAAQAAFAQATPLPHNGFKLELGRAIVARAIRQVGGVA